MMKQKSFYLVLFGLMVGVGNAMASGIPVYSYAEMVNQKVDEMKSDVVSKMVETQKALMDSASDAIGGPNTFSPNALKSALDEALLPPSNAITGQYEGLKNILGDASEYGQIEIKKCGENADEVIRRLNETIVVPINSAERMQMTTKEVMQREKERLISIQEAATTGLAKAWVVQSDTSDVAESISTTQKELDNADSQMDVFATLVRLQEETQKSLNTRLSVISDDVTASSMFALTAIK